MTEETTNAPAGENHLPAPAAAETAPTAASEATDSPAPEDASGEHAAVSEHGSEHAPGEHAPGEHAGGEHPSGEHRHRRRGRDEDEEDEPQAAPLDPAEARREALEKHFLDVVEFERVRDIVARQCATALGRKVLRRMKPLRNRDAAVLCLEQTDEMARLLKERERVPLADVHDAGWILRRAVEASRPLEPKELRKIVATLDAARSMRDLIVSFEEDKFPRLRSLARHLDPVPHVEEAIRRAIDARGEVRDDASERLFAIRGRIRELKQRIESMLAHISQSSPSLQKALQNPRPVFRGGRMVLAVKAPNRGELPGILQDRSKTGGTVFIEPEKVVPLGNELQDLSFEESAEITRILWDVTRLAMDSREPIERTTTTLGWLDFTHAKARFLKELDLSIPELSDDGRLELLNARHPILLDMKRAQLAVAPSSGAMTDVVPLTVRLGETFDMLLITGPNTGGKTVALKTVGLATIMAQCGLPIAASKGSRVPVFQSWFADIGDEQSIQQSLSTFSAHLTRLKEVLDGATKDTLVLVDELGAGTDPLEGAALGRAVLEKILASGAKSLVTTHLGSLKQFAFTNPRAENGAMAFDHETLRPTYRLILGQPGNSNALAIAKRLGVDGAVVTRAEELLKVEDTRSAELIESITKIRVEAESHRERADSLRRGVEAEKKRLEEERHKLEAQRKVIQREADNEMDERFSGLKRAVKNTAEALKNAPTPYGEHMSTLQKTVEELLSHTPFEQKRREFAKSLKKGDTVFVISLGGTGMVTRIHKERGQLTVMVGALPIETTFDNVSWIEGRSGAQGPRTAPRPAPREGEGREQGGRREGGREHGGREHGGREHGGREHGGREHGGREGGRGRGGPPGGGRGGPGGRGGRFGGRDRESEVSATTPFNVFGSSGTDTSGPPGAFGSTGVKPDYSRQGGGGGRGGRGRGRGGPGGAAGGDAARRMGPGGTTRPVPPSLHAPWKPPAAAGGESTGGESTGEAPSGES